MNFENFQDGLLDSEKLMKRSKAIEQRNERAIEEKSKLLKNIETSEDLKITQEKYHTRQMLYAENLSIRHNGLHGGATV